VKIQPEGEFVVKRNKDVVKKEEVITDFNRVYDCLVGMDAIIDNHLDTYNDVLASLVTKARDIIEDTVRDLKK
jgi:carbon monoxide dehydrogenase subunit G